ncbi:hypothetical protein ATANTOWER_027802 [Ataeniobius toweri]|uniref:Uncharacterized protein n=1 Tax=Ataeniobius toweri TaxID=208326 RepID=A0ABU7BCB0_9TELE|nr:hypothetical protein [Ataeniobius toweri]
MDMIRTTFFRQMSVFFLFNQVGENPPLHPASSAQKTFNSKLTQTLKTTVTDFHSVSPVYTRRYSTILPVQTHSTDKCWKVSVRTLFHVLHRHSVSQLTQSLLFWVVLEES